MGEIPEDLRDRIMQEQDLEVLQKWLRLAAQNKSVEAFMKKIFEDISAK